MSQVLLPGELLRGGRAPSGAEQDLEHHGPLAELARREAFVLTRFLSGLLFGVEATDPLTFLAVPGLVLLAALLASWVPAHRATEADPMSILRAS